MTNVSRLKARVVRDSVPKEGARVVPNNPPGGRGESCAKQSHPGAGVRAVPNNLTQEQRRELCQTIRPEAEVRAVPNNLTQSTQSRRNFECVVCVQILACISEALCSVICALKRPLQFQMSRPGRAPAGGAYHGGGGRFGSFESRSEPRCRLSPA